MKNTNWSKSHFCTYIFLCIAYSDDKITVSEIVNIKDFLSKINISDEEAKEIIKEVCFLLNSQNIEERLVFIAHTYKDFFNTTDDLSPLMNDIEDLILADNNIEKSEILMYNKIRKAMNVME